MKGTSSPDTVSTRLRRIAEQARQAPQMVLTTLAHHIDMSLLHEAYRLTRKDGAVGVDDQTAAAYAANLEGNLQSLLDRFKSGSYFAPPVRRVHIPKGDGSSTRPIGIPTFEDKVLQRAVKMVLEAVYEQDFLDCSYGFRAHRSSHMALQRLWDGLMDMKGGVVLEADIRGFFDSVDHSHLRTFLDFRVRDGVLRRAIDKWLKAGVLEDGELSFPDEGTPQGGVISPLLGNIYLHEVLDKWFETDVKPRLSGRAFLVRYADDFIIVFSLEDDARRVFDVLPKRFGKYGLTLHPEKTRLVPFRKPPKRPPRDPQEETAAPGVFELLGFTHYWAKSRRGSWIVMRKTGSKRFVRSVRNMTLWCRANRHLPVAVQRDALNKKLDGHYGYYGITNNMRALHRFFHAVMRVWHKWLGRRSRQRMTWERFNRMLERLPLSPPRIVQSVYRV